MHMTQESANRDVRLLLMNNKTCQQERKGRRRGSVGWLATVVMAVVMVFASLLFVMTSGVAFAATWGPNSITDTNNDGYEWEGGPDWYANDQPYNYNYLGHDGGQLNIGLRFTNITIPQGAIINSATIEVYCPAGDIQGTPTGQWQAWDADNAGQFDGSNRPSTVPLTTASVTHNPTSRAGWKSASIGSVIQEIIDRPGWISGNAINLVWMSTNTGDGVWQDFNDVRQGSNPARLTIDYDQQGGTYSSTSLITINEDGSADPYPSTITVPSLSGTVTKVTVTITGLTHTYPDDVRILLVGPQGENVLLMYNQGGEYDVNGVNLTFDDNAASQLPDSQITEGTYKPCSDTQNDDMNSPAPARPYGTTLSVFNSIDPQGDWSLYVLDWVANDSGSISGGWELNITTVCWSSELLENPGFETGDAEGWSNGGGGTVDIGLKCENWCDDDPHSGSYQAYWEDPAAGYYLYQDVDLSSYASDIDAGDALITATGWLISNEYDPLPYDVFYMQVRFYDETLTEIVGDRYDTGTVNNENWAQYGITSYTIPTGARWVQIRFYTWETDGSNWYNAGSADDFSLKVGTPCGSGETITYQRGDGKGSVSETDDASLRSDNPATNYGSAVDLLVDDSPDYHTVIKFPNIFGGGSNQIPLGSAITSATLTVEVYDSGTDIDVYQLTESWIEDQVTWNNRLTGTAWSNAGADGTLSHKTTPDDTFTNGSTGTKNIDVTTSVQNWSDGEANQGWVFIDTTSGGVDIRSSEYATVASRPKLSVTYTPPTTTLGDGTDPGNTTIAPGTADTELDFFTLQTNGGTDSVTALTVTTANTTAVASMEIWDDIFTTQYFSTVSAPSGDDWNFSGGTPIPVTTTPTSFGILFTAEDHTLSEGTYAVTGTVTSTRTAPPLP
jgi:subtilisin-like proprotein convertase family protein